MNKLVFCLAPLLGGLVQIDVREPFDGHLLGVPISHPAGRGPHLTLFPGPGKLSLHASVLLPGRRYPTGRARHGLQGARVHD